MNPFDELSNLGKKSGDAEYARLLSAARAAMEKGEGKTAIRMMQGFYERSNKLGLREKVIPLLTPLMRHAVKMDDRKFSDTERPRRLAKVRKRLQLLARLEEALDIRGLVVSAARKAKKNAPKKKAPKKKAPKKKAPKKKAPKKKRQTRLHRHFDIAGDKQVPMTKIRAEIKRLTSLDNPSDSDSSLLRALTRAQKQRKKK